MGSSEEGDRIPAEGLCLGRLQEEIDSEPGFEGAKRSLLASSGRIGIRGGAGHGDICPQMGRRLQLVGVGIVVPDGTEQFIKVLSLIEFHPRLPTPLAVLGTITHDQWLSECAP